MTNDELVEFNVGIVQAHELLLEKAEALDLAAADAISTDVVADALAEAIFLRAFTAYEACLERLFFHYLLGGTSLQGRRANSYVQVPDEQLARKLVRGGFRFLSWAKPETIRQTASTYIERGWPLVDLMSASSQELADCERVRNKIAHDSTEAAVEFNAVQRNLLSTERLFPISPGQLLRIRHRSHRQSHLVRYMKVMNGTVCACIDPPA